MYLKLGFEIIEETDVEYIMVKHIGRYSAIVG
jgi:hypothetical protein